MHGRRTNAGSHSPGESQLRLHVCRRHETSGKFTSETMYYVPTNKSNKYFTYKYKSTKKLESYYCTFAVIVFTRTCRTYKQSTANFAELYGTALSNYQLTYVPVIDSFVLSSIKVSLFSTVFFLVDTYNF